MRDFFMSEFEFPGLFFLLNPLANLHWLKPTAMNAKLHLF